MTTYTAIDKAVFVIRHARTNQMVNARSWANIDDANRFAAKLNDALCPDDRSYFIAIENVIDIYEDF